MSSSPRQATLLGMADEILTQIVYSVEPEALPLLRLTCKAVCNVVNKPFGQLAHRRFILTKHSLTALIELTAHPVLGSCVRGILLVTYDLAPCLSKFFSVADSNDLLHQILNLDLNLTIPDVMVRDASDLEYFRFSSGRVPTSNNLTRATVGALVEHEQFRDIHLEACAIGSVQLLEFLKHPSGVLKRLLLVEVRIQLEWDDRDFNGEPFPFMAEFSRLLHHDLDLEVLEVKNLIHSDNMWPPVIAYSGRKWHGGVEEVRGGFAGLIAQMLARFEGLAMGIEEDGDYSGPEWSDEDEEYSEGIDLKLPECGYLSERDYASEGEKIEVDDAEWDM